MRSRHINIPLFIPHLGCPHDCVFCDQKTISGRSRFDGFTKERVYTETKEKLTASLDSLRELRERGQQIDAEIAFFGGSFTGIERDLMEKLLTLAEAPLAKGLVSGIRLSTRPDLIDERILRLLSDRGVSDIELGIQSMSDRVLLASGRGHTSTDSRNAVAAIRHFGGFRVVGQMMVGLPASSIDDEVATVTELCEMGIDGARIYPTAVIAGTKLDELLRRGDYTPLTAEEAVTRAAAVLAVLEEHSVPCLRVGLCAEEGLAGDGGVIAGGYHPAIGEMVYAERWKCQIESALSKAGIAPGSHLTLTVPVGSTSAVIGYRKANKRYFTEKYRLSSFMVRESERLSGRELILTR